MQSKTYYNLSINETIEILNTDVQKGLSITEVEKRQKVFGFNKFPERKNISQIEIFFNQFKSSLIYILIIAGIINLIFNRFADFIVIFAAIILNTIVGYIQEAKSSKALHELKKVLSTKATVVRNGNMLEILSKEIVPGDIVLLKPGDKVPADGRIIESYNLKINESILTGEWLSALKNTNILPENTPLADRDNIAYMGTVVEDGKGRLVVSNTGTGTEIGRINILVSQTEEEKTPYQKKIAHFSKIIGIIIGIICLVIFVEGLISGREFIEMFTMSVAVAVAAIPEGLPVALTVILAIGMQRILKRKGLVKKLVAAETLGSTSIIVTDKTGTLTEAKMMVAGIYSFYPENEKSVLKNAILCSEAFVENINDKLENWIIRGDATEKALILFAAKLGFLKNQFNQTEPQINEIPFSSEYKYSASLRKILNTDNAKPKNIIYVKGAPEIILEKSKYLNIDNKKSKLINKNERILFNEKYKELTEKGYRVLGVAYKNINNAKTDLKNLNNFIDNLVFNGFIYFEDPVRKEAKEAIQICYQAGMKPIIATGDHKLTAKAIARKLGLNIKEENILEGQDLDRMSDNEFDEKINNIQIYARVEPKHKLRIIKAWQKKGEVVAMTGDGVNDAPALKQADIGIALGSGTEVAKEISDIVLLDDNFSVIVAAVQEGRAILDNIRKVVTYLLSDSFTEIILISSAILASSTVIKELPLPITAIQILWINLIEDGLPNIALAFEPKEKDLMKQKARNRETSLLTREMKVIIFVVGLITDLILLGLFFWLWNKNHSIEYVQTMIFACLAIDSILYVFCCKSLRKNLWNINIFDNKFLIGAWVWGVIGLLFAIYIPALNKLLGTVPVSFFDWCIIGGLGIVNVVLIEVVKYYFIKKDNKYFKMTDSINLL